MDYKDLQVFLSLCSCLHLGKASVQLHMSPSTLSRRLVRMDEVAGAQPVARDPSLRLLTAAGERYRQHAEQALLGWQELRTALSADVSDLSGRVTLYCS